MLRPVRFDRRHTANSKRDRAPILKVVMVLGSGTAEVESGEGIVLLAYGPAESVP